MSKSGGKVALWVYDHRGNGVHESYNTHSLSPCAANDWVMCETGFCNWLAYGSTPKPEFMNAKPESCNHFFLICVDSTDGRAYPH